MLVTSLRDGMNLVAKEYVACRNDETGALVLSEFTGAADELGSAFLVNPHDIEGLKDAIVRAATISPREARRRMRSMRRTVREHDVAYWARTFLDALQQSPEHGQLASEPAASLTTAIRPATRRTRASAGPAISPGRGGRPGPPIARRRAVRMSGAPRARRDQRY
jgi:trehalose-6-phosphate synthase